MLRISPSLASSDLLHLAEEIDFADKYFDALHLDIEDGVAIPGITFGIKMCQKALAYSKACYRSVHLEVFDPLAYLADLRQLKIDICYLQVCHLQEAETIIQKYQAAGIVTGIDLTDIDLKNNNYQALLPLCEDILVSTAGLNDLKQQFIPKMAEFALDLAAKQHKKVIIDGGVSFDIYRQLSHSNLKGVVMGRAVFENKAETLRQLATLTA